MVRVTVRLTEHQISQLRALAAKQGLSVSAVIRRAIDRMLALEPPDDAGMRRRAKSVAGCFNSGLGDLAERHDDYLDEVYSE